jgi:hypothetical protein
VPASLHKDCDLIRRATCSTKPGPLQRLRMLPQNGATGANEGAKLRGVWVPLACLTHDGNPKDAHCHTDVILP